MRLLCDLALSFSFQNLLEIKEWILCKEIHEKSSCFLVHLNTEQDEGLAPAFTIDDFVEEISHVRSLLAKAELVIVNCNLIATPAVIQTNEGATNANS